MLRPADPGVRWLSFTVGLALGFFLLLSHSERAPSSSSSSSALSSNSPSWPPLPLVGRLHGPDHLSDYRRSAACNMSSMDLHDAHAPRCTTRAGLLRAMSSGGRRGWDAPYHPRGCDMRFFTAADVCSILGRFDHIYLVGDRMMRLLAQALMVLVRRDLVDGGRVTWTNRMDEYGCDCRALFERPECHSLGVVNTAAVLAGDPDSIRCRGKLGAISYTPAEAYPLSAKSLATALAQIKEPVSTRGRDVFILGHGLLNDFETGETLAWLEQLEEALSPKVPGLYAGSDGPASSDADAANPRTGGVPRLFITPSAQGVNKPDEFLRVQNNIRLMRFTHGVSTLAEARGYEVLQTYNFSCQATTPDGVYGSYEQNIMKAMMVLNWLDAIDVGP